jgi:hypothetical protein
MAAPKLLTARESFGAQVDGKELLVHAGQRVAADHPLVEGREELFKDEAQPDLEAPKPPPKRRRKAP